MSGGENKTIFTHEKLIKSLNYKLMKYVTKIKCKWKNYSLNNSSPLYLP